VNGQEKVMANSLRLDSSEIDRALAEFMPRVRAAMTVIFDYWKLESETRMRTGARWTDRTGNARAGLTAIADHTADASELVLFHKMPYGIWLEIRYDWNGKYAIIGPLLPQIGIEMMEMIKSTLFQLAERGSG
jgi:hypothetical protein